MHGNSSPTLRTGTIDCPGGWIEERIDLGQDTVRFTRPAEPDFLLDDLAVIAANEADDYMPYWASLWNASPILARLIREDPPAFDSAVEIGCGLGLVGVSLALCGLRTIVADYDPDAVATAVSNAELNGLAVRGLVVDWRKPAEFATPLLVGADLVYESRNHAPLLRFAEEALTRGGEFWLGDPGRAEFEDYCAIAVSAGFDIRFCDDRGTACHGPKRGEFRLAKMRRLAVAKG